MSESAQPTESDVPCPVCGDRMLHEVQVSKNVTRLECANDHVEGVVPYIKRVFS